MSRKFLFGLAGLLGGAAIIFFVNRGTFESTSWTRESSASKRSAVETIASQVKPALADDGVRAIRREYVETADLKSFYDGLKASSTPGALLYANLAMAECLNFSSHFGQGAAAWEKFYQKVSDTSSDRGLRIRAFQSELGRCERFEPSSAPAVVGMIKATFDPKSSDPWVKLSSNIIKAGVNPSAVSDSEFNSLAISALATKDPEIIESLGVAIFSRGKRGGDGLTAQDEAIATRFAWGAAIEQSYGAAPMSYRSMQVAACIVGQGCDSRSVLDIAERKMWDLPPQRSAAILARAKALTPDYRAALDSRSVDAVLGLGAQRRQ